MALVPTQASGPLSSLGAFSWIPPQSCVGAVRRSRGREDGGSQCALRASLLVKRPWRRTLPGCSGPCSSGLVPWIGVLTTRLGLWCPQPSPFLPLSARLCRLLSSGCLGPGPRLGPSQRRCPERDSRLPPAGLRCGSALFRHEVGYVLGQLQHEAAVPHLAAALARPAESPMVRHECAEALGAIARPACLAVLRAHAADPERVVRESCEVALDMYAHENAAAFQYADGLEQLRGAAC
nr:deoxyhypusine hydroxylase-like [Microcebus murinus]